MARRFCFEPPSGFAVELSDTPFFAQTQYHCGPAALATLLAADGLEVTPEELTPLVYVPERHGSLQAEMLAATRQYQRIPLRLQPDPAELISALDAGSPVLVLQNLGLESLPVWHYAVVIGFDSQSNKFVLRSGEDERLEVRAQIFLKSWDLAGRWAFIAAHADHVAPMATPASWIAAAAPFESIGNSALARRAYLAAQAQWPADALSRLAMANLEYSEGDLDAALTQLSEAVHYAPDDVAARNNLAQVLLEKQCPASARAQMDRIIDIPAWLQDAVSQTRAEIDGAGDQDAPECAGLPGQR